MIMVLESAFQADADQIFVLVDYGKHAVGRAIASGRFDHKYIDLNPEEIPLNNVGQSMREVRAVNLGRKVRNHELERAIRQFRKGLPTGLTLGMADPLVTISYANALDELPNLAATFTSHGQLWAIHVYERIRKNRVRERILRIRKTNPDSFWSYCVKFPAVFVKP